MTISGISANDVSSAVNSSQNDSSLGQDAFMRLLVEQMKAQDPLEPTGNDQMLAQLAQFESLDKNKELVGQMEQLNANIVGLAVLQQSNALLSQLTSASGLIGQDVQYTDASSGDQLWGRVDSVKVEDGVASLQIGGKSVPLTDVLQVGTPPTVDPDSDSNA